MIKLNEKDDENEINLIDENLFDFYVLLYQIQFMFVFIWGIFNKSSFDYKYLNIIILINGKNWIFLLIKVTI